MTITNGRPEGRGFDSRLCHCNSSLTQHFRAHYDPEIYSASNSNECQEYFLENSCADSLEISESQPTGTLKVCPGLNRDWFTFTSVMNNVLDTMCNYRSCYDLLAEGYSRISSVILVSRSRLESGISPVQVGLLPESSGSPIKYIKMDLCRKFVCVCVWTDLS